VIISGTSNTYTGETEIFRGFLKIGADDALPTGNVLDVGANDNIVNGFNDTATFDLNGFNQTIAELKSDGIGNRIVTNTGALKTLTVNQSTNTTFGGDITTDSNTTSGQIEGALALTKSNTGTLTLAGVNTYTGDTTVSGGTLALSATGSIDDSASIQLGVDGTFDVSAIATYAMAGSQPFTFDLDGSGAGSAGFLDAAGLDISAAVVNFNILSALDDLAYILAGYTELTGAQFASVTEPAGYVLDYNYLDGNQIALVQQTVIPTPAALPAGLILLALTAMRRRRD
jgi:autotransporter-associated beta strand protein